MAIAIIDYGAGSLRSVQNTLDEIGANYELVREPGGLERAPKIILPGVGHFPQSEAPGKFAAVVTSFVVQ